MNNIKILYFFRIDFSKGNGVNKASASKGLIFATTGIFKKLLI